MASICSLLHKKCHPKSIRFDIPNPLVFCYTYPIVYVGGHNLTTRTTVVSGDDKSCNPRKYKVMRGKTGLGKLCDPTPINTCLFTKVGRKLVGWPTQNQSTPHLASAPLLESPIFPPQERRDICALNLELHLGVFDSRCSIVAQDASLD